MAMTCSMSFSFNWRMNQGQTLVFSPIANKKLSCNYPRIFYKTFLFCVSKIYYFIVQGNEMR